MSKPWLRLILDSGAFTAWRQGAEISLRNYIRFCLRHQHLIHQVVNLDVIPRSRSPHHAEEAAKQGWQNLCQMRLAGLNPIAVYHHGERRYWLEKMIGEGVTTIGLGGVATMGDKSRRPWIDSTFDYLRGSHGYPSVRVHGFGITSVDLMLAYPWATVDSVSWMKQAVIGSVYVPKLEPFMGMQLLKDGYREAFYHGQAPMALAMSEAGRKGPSALSMIPHAHYNSLGEETKKVVDAYFELQHLTAGELKKNYKMRVRLNARFFQRFQKERPSSCGCKIRLDGHGLCPNPVSNCGSDDPPKNFKVFLSVGTYIEYSNILRQEGIRNQLVSYHRIVTGAKFDFKKWINTGWFFRATRPDTLIL